MKKIIGAIILVALVGAVLAGCSSAPTVSPAWGDDEILTYKITDTKTGVTKGSMEIVTERRPEDKTLSGKEYESADGKTTVKVTTDGYSVTVTFLTSQYTVLAEEKVITTAEGTKTIVAYHSGKYAYYTVNGEEKDRLNVGSTGYTEAEYLYNYIRCFNQSATPTSIKIADYENGAVNTVSTAVVDAKEISVPYPSGAKMVKCNGVEITLNATPQGASIKAYYTPDDKDNTVGGSSIASSKKFPVVIIENDMTYVLESIVVK